MGNPFDQIINVNEKKESGSSSTGFDKNWRPGGSGGADKFNISLSINKRSMERLFYIAIIIVLAVMVFYNPFAENNCSTSNASLNGAAVANEKETAVENAPKAPATVVENAPVTQNKTEEKNTSSVNQTVATNTTATINTTTPATENLGNKSKPFITNFDLIIDKIDYELSTEGDPLKIKSITFTLSNRWAKFKPMIIVHWYDIQASPLIKAKNRSVKVYQDISVGDIDKYTLYEYTSYMFHPEDTDSEIIAIDIADANTGTVYKTITREIP